MIRVGLIFIFAVAICGCNGVQSASGGQGLESSNIVDLFLLFLAVCTIMYLLVCAALLTALRRKKRPEGPGPFAEENSRLIDLLLLGWLALVILGLIVLTVASFFADRSNASIDRKNALQITVTANQWWWDVEYRPADPFKIVRTANELHLPVGTPAQITLRSNDVIHSFWVPNLAGKQDLIPGRISDVQLLPRQTGLYRGQCAEFCGVQHAQMALDVTVESAADFQRWYARQLQPAKEPATPLQVAGYRYVTTRECSNCHQISGTVAAGKIAPDLTHLASRRSIAAGAMPMNRGNLYGWIADPQSLKPGSHMPTIGIAPKDLHAVVAYLETLK